MSALECPRCGAGQAQPANGCWHEFHGAPPVELPGDLANRYRELRDRVEEEAFRQKLTSIFNVCPVCGSNAPSLSKVVRDESGAHPCSHEFHRREPAPMGNPPAGPREASVSFNPHNFPEATSLLLTGSPDRFEEVMAKMSQGKEISRWADAAMFRSEAMPKEADGRVRPRAYILNATPDPLGSLAALNAIYTGEVVRDLKMVTDAERRAALREVFKNKLQGPLEVIQFHILLEGVSRAFTHQAVRGRRAFYAQESLRFAVVEGEDWKDRVATPPRFEFWTEGQREEWEAGVMQAEDSYARLVGSGIPAEDARGLMPHAMTTRIHWVCSLRELLYVAGVRLCTQAQFEWRLAMASVVQSLRGYGTAQHEAAERVHGRLFIGSDLPSDGWQFHEIANLLRPICYQEGACGFKATADRACSIRERVDFRERYSENRKDSSQWHKPMIADVVRYPAEADPYHGTKPYIETVTSPGIDPAEWLTDPNAAR